MGIGAKFVMLLPILCFLQLSHSMDDGCNRTNRETVKDLMSLITRLFDQKTNVRLIFSIFHNPFPHSTNCLYFNIVFIPLLFNS